MNRRTTDIPSSKGWPTTYTTITSSWLRQPPVGWLSLVLVVATLAAYWPIVNHDFLDWDDNQTIQLNPDFSPANAHPDWGHYWTKPYLELYIPLTYMLWGITSRFAQVHSPDGTAYVLDAGLYHAVSLALHCGCILLVFAVLRRLTHTKWPAWFGALIFALHPLQVESVAWITSTSILLSTVFSLGAIWHFLRFTELAEGPPSGQPDVVPGKITSSRPWMKPLHYGLATLAFALALLSKPSVVVLPLIVAVIEIGFRRRSAGRLAAPLAIWLLMCIPIILLTQTFQSGWMIHVPLIRRPLVALDAIGFYLTKLVWPASLIPDYGRTPQWLFDHPQAFVILVVPTAVALLAAMLWRRSRWLGVSAAIFVLALLPIIGLTPFSYQRFSTVSDRYIYLAMLAAALALAMLLAARPSRIAYVLAGLWALILGSMTFLQQAHWRDTPTLFKFTLAVNPDSLAANYTLGAWYASHGNLEKAIAYDRAALRARPRDGRVLCNLGVTLIQANRFPEAIDAFNAALAPSRTDANPDHPTTGGPPTPKSGAESIGPAYVDDALPAEERPKAYDNLGIAYIRTSDLENAIANFERAVRLQGNYEPARKHLALARKLRDQAALPRLPR